MRAQGIEKGRDKKGRLVEAELQQKVAKAGHYGKLFVHAIVCR